MLKFSGWAFKKSPRILTGTTQIGFEFQKEPLESSIKLLGILTLTVALFRLYLYK
jgi:hypothetical protein